MWSVVLGVSTYSFSSPEDDSVGNSSVVRILDIVDSSSDSGVFLSLTNVGVVPSFSFSCVLGPVSIGEDSLWVHSDGEDNTFSFMLLGEDSLWVHLDGEGDTLSWGMCCMTVSKVMGCMFMGEDS